MRKLLPLAGCSGVVLPVIAPSSTDQCSGRPSQPVRSFPLNRDLKPASSAANATDEHRPKNKRERASNAVFIVVSKQTNGVANLLQPLSSQCLLQELDAIGGDF